MSDTEDGFDEEAVRRELREKYEDDDREETERMSELLLQGATMTNQHCDHCGTPIFRYDGRAFCPNCQHADQQAQAQAQAAEQPQDGQQAQSVDESAGQPAGQSQGQPTDQTAGQPTGQSQREPRADRRQAHSQQSTPEQARTQNGNREAAATPSQTASSQSTPSQTAPSQGAPTQTTPSQGAAPSGEAADALESSISALARRAAGSDDPRRAREYLEAAREAAEALDALRPNA
ncbi:MAG: Sjogren's syndrome/scleroderma autoantigen 1 family protein [Halobacterium sp.]